MRQDERSARRAPLGRGLRGCAECGARGERVHSTVPTNICIEPDDSVCSGYHVTREHTQREVLRSPLTKPSLLVSAIHEVLGSGSKE